MLTFQINDLLSFFSVQLSYFGFVNSKLVLIVTVQITVILQT